MILCHSFNSFTRMDLRQEDGYLLSQFLGGMAAPLFLFMAGMTLGFGMDSLEKREPSSFKRWTGALRRAGYVWGIAYLFRLSNWAAGFPSGTFAELTKVDILNCMGLAMAVMAFAAPLSGPNRIRAGAIAGFLIAGLAPLASNMDWTGVPQIVHEYLAPGPWKGRFAFFPCGAYVAFGMAAGTIVKRTLFERMERLMQWSAVTGFALVLGAGYFSHLPYSIYKTSDFWRDSPALIFIRAGVILLIATGSYLWTTFVASGRWSWMQALGKTSLMAYWVHVMLVYGTLLAPMKRALTVQESALATAAVTALMVALAAAKLRWTSAGRPLPRLVSFRRRRAEA
jgi:uncharacterized membrane protein